MVQASILANQPVVFVYLGQSKKFYVLVWELVNNCRQRTMNVIDFSGGTVNEGTYMAKKQTIVDSFCAEEVDTSNSKPIFNYDVPKQLLVLHCRI
jgi:hypothetical protein